MQQTKNSLCTLLLCLTALLAIAPALANEYYPDPNQAAGTANQVPFGQSAPPPSTNPQLNETYWRARENSYRSTVPGYSPYPQVRVAQEDAWRPIPAGSQPTNPDEMFKYGYWLYKKECHLRTFNPTELSQAVHWMTLSAEAGDSRAQFLMGEWYWSGIENVLTADADKSFYWYQQSAEKGERGGLFEMGRAYETGNHKSKDAKKAFACYLASAEKNYTPAEYVVGKSYVLGSGCPIDRTKAVFWLNKAHANGNMPAEELLSAMRAPGCPAHFASEAQLYAWVNSFVQRRVAKIWHPIKQAYRPSPNSPSSPPSPTVSDSERRARDADSNGDYDAASRFRNSGATGADMAHYW